MSESLTTSPAIAGASPPTCSASPVDHAQILRTWEDSLKDLESRIRVEKQKIDHATITHAALQDAFWKLEGRLDVAKELVRKQSLPND